MALNGDIDTQTECVLDKLNFQVYYNSDVNKEVVEFFFLFLVDRLGGRFPLN